ncbi:hypothetical protein OG978_32345 [Streptomyces sp. NBC_01591]|uniref:hypothetical protein n=1 Tax=Streptomyces sp. NBC_01591 TaxID=2975888 RepID=UPI002DD939B6|nr:hypothetical protein [Streptomyces sp. NBC_01591]WSD71664.1 hypothetical protein OG978_32345 [Streptomyces sp. NBC_01591]
MNNKPSPQLGAATALVQLLSENPHLPMLDWTLPEGGAPLMGAIVDAGVDMRPVVAAYAEVLGGTIRELEFIGSAGLMYSASLYVTWRDVRIQVKAICSVSACTMAVAA